MAARYSADGQDHNRAIALGTQAALSFACWFKISVDRNDWSSVFFVDNGTSDNWGLQTGSDGVTMATVFDASTQEGMGALTVGVWYYACLATSGTSGFLYHKVLGAPSLTVVSVTSVTANVNAATLRIGESPWGAEWLNGCVVGAKFWLAQLGRTEAECESQQLLPMRTANLAGAWPLVRPDPLDYSGNGRALGGGAGASFEDGPPIPWMRVRPRLTLSAPAGGTTFTLSVAGAVTPSSSVARQPHNHPAGAITPTASAVKQTQRSLTGTTTPAGATLKMLARLLGGAATPSGAIGTVRTRLLSLAGSATPTGSLSQETAKPLAGANTPAGALAKQPHTHMSGSATPSGTLATVRARIISLLGGVIPAGTLTRQSRKDLDGSTTPAGHFTRSTAKRFLAAITPSGALSATRARYIALAGAVAPAGALVRSAGRMLGGSTTPIGGLVKHVSRTLIGAVNPSGVALKLLGRLIGGATTPTGAVTAQIVNTVAWPPSADTPTTSALFTADAPVVGTSYIASTPAVHGVATADAPTVR